MNTIINTGNKRTIIMLLGCGELGKEVAIEAQRLGLFVIGVDRYENAPAMQVAHKSFVINMLDGNALEKLILDEKPDIIIPEIEAIATDRLVELEKKGVRVVPNAQATLLTMNRERIRTFASSLPGVKTGGFGFASSYDEFCKVVENIGIPCVVKPVMSSSGKGQSVIKHKSEVKDSWDYAQAGGRAGAGKVIVEAFINFDYEITLLTVKHKDGTIFCEPIGHRQSDGDYRESWQPQKMSDNLLAKAKETAKAVTDGIGGYGIFGVELFICGDEVIFSELSPRPHDTGMVTLISQNYSEFELHLRAVLGLPIPNIRQYGPAASAAILAEGVSKNIVFSNLENVLKANDTEVKIFAKPEVNGKRRVAVALALGKDTNEAVKKACFIRDNIIIKLN